MFKKFTRRALALILTLAIITIVSPAITAADKDYYVDNYGPGTVIIDDFVIDGYGILRWYIGKSGELVIPDGVEAIGSGEIFSQVEYENDITITSVVIPESVTIIHPHAFTDLSNLTSMTILNGDTVIVAGQPHEKKLIDKMTKKW